MSTSTTKHNKPSIVVAGQNRDEVLSFSIRNNNNNKRKIGNTDNNDDDTTGDNEDNETVIQQQRVRAAQTSQSQLCRCWCTFHDFRLSTIHEHPSFVWLGPSSMAVYWYKEYLQTMTMNKQGWIRIPKEFKKNSTTIIIPQPSQHPTTAIKGTTIRTLLQRNKVERKPQQIQKQNSKGNFYFIPGQYLRPDPPDGARIVVYNSDCTNISSTMMAVDNSNNNNNNNNNNKDDSNNNIVVSTTDTTTIMTATATAACTEATNTNNTNTTNTTTNSIRIQKILRYGVPDIHYATSYIGVYNLLRSYGRFIKISSKKSQNQNTGSSFSNGNRSTSSNKRRRCNKEEEGKQQQHQHQQNQKEDEDLHIVVPFDYKGPDLIIPKEQQDDPTDMTDQQHYQQTIQSPYQQINQTSARPMTSPPTLPPTLPLTFTTQNFTPVAAVVTPFSYTYICTGTNIIDTTTCCKSSTSTTTTQGNTKRDSESAMLPTLSILTYIATIIERATTLSDGLPEKGSTRTRTLRRYNNCNQRKRRTNDVLKQQEPTKIATKG
ncbi:hypothetical protein FRACYDRAFT_244144 [Fragilariopsis cylindrus CCMP1102]|uniref:Uncharacterized protein n=1 Tax=Fragilariopsis cylindrus CCMP1102 TaxID=635003 RepID=A0A1E7F3W1_9STRA|nr:hypothetical protein FRACYDRAFT_244144 [Fragilariopsis cylindrus CCMP1102]|eukprot:OEU12871.1 hypothetical protein FRACYDRAFT_244144 [Fragilariopsis cylindrus CCMP1102]